MHSHRKPVNPYPSYLFISLFKVDCPLVPQIYIDNLHWFWDRLQILLRITWFIVFNTNYHKLSPLTELFCNFPLLKDISFNTKCLLVCCAYPVTTCLVRAIFRYHRRDFWKFWITLVLFRQFQNFQKCIRAVYPKSSSQTCDY